MIERYDDVLRDRLFSLSRSEAESFYGDVFSRDDRDAVRWLGRNDRYFLLTCLCGRSDARHDWIYARCREVERSPDDHLDLWSRDHYKSTIITFAGIIQEILRDPEITICIFSHDKPAAKDFLRQIKFEFETNGLLVWAYDDILWGNPRKQAPTWGEDSGITVIRKSNPKEATVECSGLLDGMATGKHFRLRVYDDIVTETTVTTPEMIRKVTSQWELSEHLGQRDGRAWHIGTRYHFADTYAIILQRGVIKERRHAATVDGTFDGDPVFLTRKQWERKKQNSSKATIASQMLLNPLAGAETKFDVRWLKFWDIRPKVLNVYIIGDPSKGRHATSDNTAFAVIGVDVHNNKYILDGYRHRMPLSQRWEALRNLYKRWSRMPGVDSVRVGYEQYGLQTDLEYFEEKMRSFGEVSFPIDEVSWPQSGPKSKQGRIERLEPDLRMGRMMLPHVIEIDDEGNVTPYDPKRKKAAQQAKANGEDWRVARPIVHKNEDGRLYDVISGFLEEYSFFPFAPKDDFLDAISRIYDMDVSVPLRYDEEGDMEHSVLPPHFSDI